MEDLLALNGYLDVTFVFVQAECGFRFIPAGYSDLKPAIVPI
ncbi:hypothetical protein GCM10007858_08470 [Bradyrhizobium liaoningense]|nr:hypothetical protein GCM10007858_08470 [Bradyrhizobium liaoningense]